jgi:small subunit ribosomal protein S5
VWEKEGIEVPEAIRKAVEQAKKSLVKFPLKDRTTPPGSSVDGSGTVVINPAVKGTGIIAGGW